MGKEKTAEAWNLQQVMTRKGLRERNSHSSHHVGRKGTTEAWRSGSEGRSSHGGEAAVAGGRAEVGLHDRRSRAWGTHHRIPGTTLEAMRRATAGWTEARVGSTAKPTLCK